jgi:hypothetical protein
MCPAVANKSAQKTIVLSLYLIWGSSAYQYAHRKKISNSDFSKKSL